MPRTIRTTSVASTTALLVAVASAVAFAPVQSAPSPLAGVAPEQVPDRGAVLSEPVRRGQLELTEVGNRPAQAKVVDGRADDWIGAATGVGGSTRWDHGELVHTDFLFDAHGADDGGDRDRLDQFAELFYLETRTERIDQVARTSGSQLGVPEPIGAPDEYGDVGGGLDAADLTEVRIARQGPSVHLLASVANLTDPADLAVLVLARTDVAGPGGEVPVGLGTDLVTERFDRAVLVRDGVVLGARDLAAGTDLPTDDIRTATAADAWENHLEVSLPTGMVATAGPGGPTTELGLVAGRIEDDGTFTALNVAFRGQEPVEIWNDRMQAFALLDGTVDDFSSGPVALSDSARGRTQTWSFGAGYHERHMTTQRPDMAREGGRDGIHQPYGLYVPTAYDPGDDDQRLPVTYWLHYRGGKAHSGTVINPRLTTQLGEERDNLVVFPNGRGTSEWYVTESHQDVFDVMADLEGELFAVDETRRYVSGYSMGGYGTWLFTTLYPDLFAAGFSQSGAVTQGAWVGTGADGDPVDPLFDQGWIEANDGDARAQLTYRALENLRHVPIAIDHGTDDELVPITGIERMAQRLTELGYEHRLTRFLGYEHFTQAVVDEWADGAAYLDRFTIDPAPREVVYSVVPALVHAVNTVDPANGASFDFAPDGAYWVDGIRVREVGDRGDGRPALDAEGTVRATSQALAAPATVTVPDAGAVSPLGHTTPFVRTGLQRLADPTGLTAAPVANALDLDLANVDAVTVDTLRAGLAAADLTVSITTDGPTVVRLAGLLGDGAPAFTVEGASLVVDGDDLLVVLDAAGTVTVSS